VILLLWLFLFWALPHCDWLPLRLHVPADEIPLGLTNVAVIAGAVLWLFGKVKTGGHPNPFRSYTLFIAIVVIETAVAVFAGHMTILDTLTAGKREISLLLLYFVPLAALRGRRELWWVLGVALVAHLVVGYETYSSGVLGGSHFSDAKRGSGPFSTGWAGSDEAGAYLAQMLMFPLALLLFEEPGLYRRVVAAAIGFVMFVGVLATYSRGSLIAVVIGFVTLFLVQRSSMKSIVLAALLLVIAPPLLPEGLVARFATTESGELDESTNLRFVYDTAAWQIFRSHPWGVGTGQVRQAMAEELPHLLDAKTLETGGPFGTPLPLVVDPHNAFLYTLLEYGVPGLLAFVFFLGSAFHAAFLVYRDRRASTELRAYALGAAGFIATFAVCNLFYANFYKEAITGSVVLHLGMLAWAREEQRAEEEEAHEAEGDPSFVEAQVAL
jgi:O-antigen ligase